MQPQRRSRSRSAESSKLWEGKAQTGSVKGQGASERVHGDVVGGRIVAPHFARAGGLSNAFVRGHPAHVRPLRVPSIRPSVRRTGRSSPPRSGIHTGDEPGLSTHRPTPRPRPGPSTRLRSLSISIDDEDGGSLIGARQQPIRLEVGPIPPTSGRLSSTCSPAATSPASRPPPPPAAPPPRPRISTHRSRPPPAQSARAMGSVHIGYTRTHPLTHPTPPPGGPTYPPAHHSPPRCSETASGFRILRRNFHHSPLSARSFAASVDPASPQPDQRPGLHGARSARHEPLTSLMGSSGVSSMSLFSGGFGTNDKPDYREYINHSRAFPFAQFLALLFPQNFSYPLTPPLSNRENIVRKENPCRVHPKPTWRRI